jgi:predicted transcriptional regulator of viral defense system
MSKHASLHRLADVAEDQWGLVTRRQAEAKGISRATIARLSSDDSGPAVLERVAFGVYHLRGAPAPDHGELRAAWLQLAPAVPAWQRTPAQGIVSHRSAASLYGLGHLPADRHEFILATRRQSRRSDVRLHIRSLQEGEWGELRGLPVTRPSRIAADLLSDSEDPGAVAQVVADAIRADIDHPGTFADSIAAHAVRFGLRRGDGLGLLAWLLDLVEDPAAHQWLLEARARAHGTSGHSMGTPPAVPLRIAEGRMV